MTANQSLLSKVFEEKIHQQLDKLTLLSKQLMKNSADASDLVSETLIKAWKSFDRFDDSKPFQNWLVKIMVNEACTMHAKIKRLNCPSLDELEWSEIPDSNHNPLGQMLENQAQKDNRAFVSVLLSYLPIEEADTLKLTYLDDKSCKEVSESIGIPEDFVRVKSYRSRQKLLKLDAPQEELEIACGAI